MTKPQLKSILGDEITRRNLNTMGMDITPALRQVNGYGPASVNAARPHGDYTSKLVKARNRAEGHMDQSLIERFIVYDKQGIPYSIPPRPFYVDFCRPVKDTYSHLYVGPPTTNAPNPDRLSRRLKAPSVESIPE